MNVDSNDSIGCAKMRCCEQPQINLIATRLAETLSIYRSKTAIQTKP